MMSPSVWLPIGIQEVSYRLFQTLLRLAMAVVVSAIGCGFASAAAPIVLLKLDDLVAAPGNAQGVSVRWQRVIDFLESQGVPAALGIIGESLESEDPRYFAWIRQRAEKGLIEFWNHGYAEHFKADRALGEKGAFDGTAREKQSEFIQRTQSLARFKLGLVLHAFGPHDSSIDGNTLKALDRSPEISMLWYYGADSPGLGGRHVFLRKVNLEAPIFVPNPESFMKDFAAHGEMLPYLALQGHPAQWDEERFSNFKRIVEWLQAQGCTFMTPSAYLRAHLATESQAQKIELDRK